MWISASINRGNATSSIISLFFPFVSGISRAVKGVMTEWMIVLNTELSAGGDVEFEEGSDDDR